MDEHITYTLITGGNRGVGKALARECAGKKMNLLLVARDIPKLRQTAGEIKKEFAVSIEIFGIDLLEKDAPSKVLNWCLSNHYLVNTLVNNAGIGGPAVFGESSPEYIDMRIMLNVRALVLLSRLFIPELKKHPESYILNIGSFSAYLPVPFRSVYAASKAFVLSFSRALKEELRGTGISVTVVNPNGVYRITGEKKRIEDHGKIVQWVILPAEKIAKIAIEGMLKGKSVIVPGFWNRILLFVSRLIPSPLKEKRCAAIFRKELSGSH